MLIDAAKGKLTKTYILGIGSTDFARGRWGQFCSGSPSLIRCYEIR